MAAATSSFDALHQGSIINSLIYGEGDSIMVNTGEDSNAVLADRILDQMRAAMTNADEADYKNGATGGYTIAQIASRGSLVDSAWSHRWRKFNVMCLYIGTNDFAQGRTKEQVLTDLLAYIDLRVAARWQVVVATLAANGFISEVNRAYVNDGILAAAVGHGFYVANCGNDANIGQAGNQNNATYFRDTVHPTVVGNGVIATYYKATLESLGLT